MKKPLLYGLLAFVAANVFLFIWFAAQTTHAPGPPPDPIESPDIALLKDRAALKFDEHGNVMAENGEKIDLTGDDGQVSPEGGGATKVERKVIKATPPPKPEIKIMRCYGIGPMSTRAQSSQLAKGLRALEMKVTESTRKPRKLIGYWVYLPPPGGRAAARLKMQEMINKGVKDIAIVYKESPKYAISLGLFRQKAIAEQRLAEMRALGYPAKLEDRHKDKTSYWLDIELEDSRKLEEARWQEMLKKYPGAQLTEKLCK